MNKIIINPSLQDVQLNYVNFTCWLGFSWSAHGGDRWWSFSPALPCNLSCPSCTTPQKTDRPTTRLHHILSALSFISHLRFMCVIPYVISLFYVLRKQTTAPSSASTKIMQYNNNNPQDRIRSASTRTTTRHVQADDDDGAKTKKKTKR